VVRRSVYDIRTIKDSKKAIRTAFCAQMAGAGFSLVEFLSSCPTNWGLTPEQALDWIKETMVPYYPLGDHKVSDIVKELKGSRY
jgi:2-oxoglutarate ferredoxin oxidoreductase subunit beta